jgi:DNA-binding CsgD family transcriptional regulator
MSALAEDLGDEDLRWRAESMTASLRGDYGRLEGLLERVRGAADEDVGMIFMQLFGTAVERRAMTVADRYIQPAIDHASERGLELFRLYFLAYAARLRLDQGRWDEAADFAAAVLRVPRTSTTPRILSLVVLALVRARRGEPEASALLDEAWALAEPTDELPRLGPVAVARAELAWLLGHPARVAEATDTALALALARQSPWILGELTCWRARAGIATPGVSEIPQECTLELDGEHEAAARAWSERGCPYEAALALAQTNEPEPLRRALERLLEMGAAPAAAIVTRRLRVLGVRGLPRGPHARTRSNVAGLTAREMEVVALLSEGLRNSEIAERLVVSTKTIDHHVSAILRKLDAPTRAGATLAAERLGLLAQSPSG